jgi:hypothetical protein
MVDITPAEEKKGILLAGAAEKFAPVPPYWVAITDASQLPVVMVPTAVKEEVVMLAPKVFAERTVVPLS